MGNYAFIDGQNLYQGMRAIGWSLDYIKLRVYLREKYEVEIAYIFMGKIEKFNFIYRALQKAGFFIIYKEILDSKDGGIKGNVDAELVLQAMIDYPYYEKAIIISSDGDFACLVRYLYQREKLEVVLSPHIYACSSLLKKAAKDKITFLNKLKRKLELISQSKRAPQ